MSQYNKYSDYYDEAYEDGFSSRSNKCAKRLKSKNKNKFKGKGHQSKFSNKRIEFDPAFWDAINDAPTTLHEDKPELGLNPAPLTGEHVQTINNISIDFDRLSDIQPIDQPYNGITTYGIRFVFKSHGPQSYYRIVWFNKNQKLRDIIYQEKLRYWKSVDPDSFSCAFPNA